MSNFRPEYSGVPGRGIAGEDILTGQTVAICKMTSEVVLVDDERTSPPIGVAAEDIQAGRSVVFKRGRVGIDQGATSDVRE